MRVNLLLALTLAATLAGNAWLYRAGSRPNFEFLPEMVHSAAYESYSANPNLPDGKTMQPAPAHTIRRGYRPFPYEPGEADALRAGEELRNPLNGDEPAVYARGAAVFRTYCQPCHGASGRGDGTVAMRGFPAPPPLNSEKTLRMKDGQMFHVITFGQKKMPGYAAQVGEDDRWTAIHYVRSLQRNLQTASALPPEVRK
jgi:mono/diheme cytochrome c family protein